jgi:tetratricopeptide (TPR) repeat protein
MELSIGDVVNSVFLVREIKHGGMGTVYICDEFDLGFPTQTLDDEEIARRREQRSTGDRKFALKTVSTAALVSGGQEQLEREALICATVPAHPYIVETFAVDHVGQAPLIVLDYASGGNLRERMERGGVDLADAVRAFRQVCVALQFLATRAILHRDLKPENVLFNEEEQVQVADFGLASLQEHAIDVLSGHEPLPPEVEPERFIGGTLPYMSPEHFGRAEFTSASDVYSFGAMLFEVLEGRLLFECGSFDAYREAHVRQRPPKVSPERAPRELRSVVAKCLEKRPGRRFSDFGEVDAALEDVVGRARLRVAAPERPSWDELEQRMPSGEWTKRGYAYGVLGRLEESLRCYERALELAPADPGGNTNVGAALERLGRLDEAVAFREKEVELHPDMPIAHAALATTYVNTGRWDDAVQQLEIATTGDPTNLRFMRDLSGLYLRQGRDEEAQALVERIARHMANDPEQYGASSWVNEGLHLGLLGNFEASLELFDEGVARHPDSLDGWYNRAVTLFCLDRLDEARESVGRALALDPQAPQALFLAGFIRLLGSHAQADAGEWQLLLAFHPDHRYASLVELLIQFSSLMPDESVLDLLAGTLDIPNGLYYRA